MDATAGVTSSRGGTSLPMGASRKEWRALSEHQHHHNHHRNAGDDVELARSKRGQSDERTIFEQRREPADVNFCSVTIDGGIDDGIIQQRIHTVARQREELQQMEIDLRAQIIARVELLEMHNSFDAQIKDHANAAAKLQEQLQEREQTLNDLERKMEEKNRELHAIKLANEAAWAKEDILREQDKELATFRRERDQSEVERAQHIKQIQDLQEHIQEKDRQLLDLQEQHRVAQETILYKDEQLREAQTWISRVQEMDALQSHTLQAELRERTEQYTQLWLGCQRQFAEMDRVHMHTVQQLQLELADARQRSGAYTDESRISHMNSKDVGQFGQTNVNQLDVNSTSSNTGILSNGDSENIQSYATSGNASIQEHVPRGVMTPMSILAMPTNLPPGQVTALHPYAMHQQKSPVGHVQQWQNQLSTADDSAQNRHAPSQVEYDMSVNGQALHRDAYINQEAVPENDITGEAKVHEGDYLVNPQSVQHISSQFHDALRLNSHKHNTVSKAQENVPNLSNHRPESQVVTSEQASYTPSESLSDASVHTASLNETTTNTGAAVFMAGKTSDIGVLDERSLLACIVRTIPPGGKIRISSTLPNRLGKMLAPLHWHDYKKKYGKLDEFVACHLELFVIEGDFIQLREGAQEMIAATAAVAKVAAAAADPSSNSSVFPSVAVTPMASQSRLKKVDPDPTSQFPVMHNQHLNGVKILSKPRVSQSHARPDPNLALKQQPRTTGVPLASRK
ncbi:hypothetical protein ACFE04_027389 [Oxalis oulophora]